MIKILICEDISYLKHIISIQLDRIFPYIKLKNHPSTQNKNNRMFYDCLYKFFK